MTIIFKKEVTPIFFSLLILIYLFCCFLISKTITLSDIYYYGKELSENQACAKALDNAKNKAASSLGEVISSDSILLCNDTKTGENCKHFSNIWTESIGIIKILSEKREPGYDEIQSSYFCKQTITAVVTKSGKSDPNFDFEIALNKNVFEIIDNKKKNEYDYESKDALTIDITPLSNMFVNIFYYSPSGSPDVYNEKITRIFPNPDCKNKFIIKEKKNYNFIEEKTTIPSSICDIEFKLTYFKRDFLDNKNKQEHLLVIATKHKIKFKYQYSIKSLKSKINEINKFDIRKKTLTVNAFFN